MENGVTVWLEVEYGYQYFRWDTGMTETELIAWWRNMPSVLPYFNDPTSLPGKVVSLTDEEFDAGTFTFPDKIPDDFDAVEHLGQEFANSTDPEDLKFIELHCRHFYGERKDGIYQAHIHEDIDSGLTLPNMITVWHAGHPRDLE